MPEKEPRFTFEQNLMRVIAAELEVIALMIAAPQKFEKPLLALSAEEVAALHNEVSVHIGGVARTLTPLLLAGIDNPVGPLFGAPISTVPQ